MRTSRAGQPKSWQERIAGYAGLPEVKAIPELNLKYPGGLDELMRRLEAEGHTVVQRGQRYFVEDFERKLIGG
jgi:hypothetical protein